MLCHTRCKENLLQCGHPGCVEWAFCGTWIVCHTCCKQNHQSYCCSISNFNHFNPFQVNVFLRVTLELCLKLSLFWWPEPLQNISRWVVLFKSLALSTTTFEQWAAFGGGADNYSFLGTLLWPFNFFVFFYTGCQKRTQNTIFGVFGRIWVGQLWLSVITM